MRLMYRLASWMPYLLPDIRRLLPVEVVLKHEKTPLYELNLLREAANAIQLRRNFTVARYCISQRFIQTTAVKP